MTNKERVEAYLKHFGTKLSTDYKDQNSAEFAIYRQETADGHEVFIAKYKSDNTINIMDDVYYYEHSLDTVIIEKVQEGITVYVDEDLWHDLYMEDQFADLYDKWKANS